MRNEFIIGLVLSPIVFLVMWLSSSSDKDASMTEPKAPLTLLDINYVPTQPRRHIPDTSFHEIDLSSGEKSSRTLKAYEGKPMILHFWAPWCGTCLTELPALESYAKAMKETVAIVNISSDKTGGESSRSHYRQSGFQHLLLAIDQQETGSGSLARVFHVSVFPTTIFISASGKELGRIIGPIGWDEQAGKLVTALLQSTG